MRVFCSRAMGVAFPVSLFHGMITAAGSVFKVSYLKCQTICRSCCCQEILGWLRWPRDEEAASIFGSECLLRGVSAGGDLSCCDSNCGSAFSFGG